MCRDGYVYDFLCYTMYHYCKETPDTVTASSIKRDSLVHLRLLIPAVSHLHFDQLRGLWNAHFCRRSILHAAACWVVLHGRQAYSMARKFDHEPPEIYPFLTFP